MWARLKRWLAGALLLGGLGSAVANPLQVELPGLTILCYHDIVDNTEGADPDAVTTSEFSSQMMLLKTQGFNVISTQDYLDHKAGIKPLPPKAVMLTFDDGYKSYYTHVFPILRAMNYPSTIAIVGSWTGGEPMPGKGLVGPVKNAFGRHLPLITPEELRELSKSPLVEIASHSYNLHYGAKANVQGSEIPAAAARMYDGKYEAEADYIERLRLDLEQNSKYLKSITGKAPRVMVWPYGKYTTQGLIAAEKTGHVISFGLDEFDHYIGSSYHLGRLYVGGNLRLPRFADFVKNTVTLPLARRHQAVQVTAQALENGALREDWLSGFVQSVSDSGVSLVTVSPFQGDRSCKLLFPMDGYQSVDVLSKVFWQVQSRTNAKLLIDINLDECSMSDENWERFTERVLKRVQAHGLIVRATKGREALVQTLLSKAYGATPSAITGSNLDTPDQKFKIIQVDACELKSSGYLIKAHEMQYEVSSSRCDSKAALERLLRSGVRNFGVNQGPLQPSGKLLSENRLLYEGILATTLL